jgi:hypothetical protein
LYVGETGYCDNNDSGRGKMDISPTMSPPNKNYMIN